MTSAIHGRNELLRPISVFDNFVGQNSGARSATDPCEVYTFAVPEVIEELPHGIRCVSERLADSERDERRRSFLAEARRELARDLDKDGETVRSLRLGLGLSQAQLADRIGSKQPHVARIERGSENLHLNTCRKLADILQVDMNRLDAALRHQEEMLAMRMERDASL